MRLDEFMNTKLTAKSAPKQRVPSTPIPDKANREPVINWLTAQITRQQNVPHVSQSDLVIAKQRYQKNLKRANLAYQNAKKSRMH